MKDDVPTTPDLVRALRAHRDRPTQRHRTGGIDPVVFGVAGAIALAMVLWGFIGPGSLGSFAGDALGWVLTHTGWLFVIAASVFTLFILVVAASRFGRITLGRDDERPEFRTVSWISMMFATGMGIGLVFYGVGEPLFFYMAPPPGTVEGSTPAAVGTAMGTTLFHWTLYPWAMYAVVGLGIAYGTFRLGRSQLFSSMFTPLFGERAVNGWGGKVINILAVLATLFGSACSLGLGAIQIGGGLESTGVIGQATTGILVVVIAVLTLCFVVSAASGIARGIQWLSNTNMVLALALAVIVFVGGPTLFVLNVLPNAIGSFIADWPSMASRTGYGDPSLAEWMGTWTIFYWAWWVSWTPFVGMFIARISRGRTVRQFIIGVLLVPSAVSLLWFAVFGGGAIGLQERAEQAGEVAAQLAAPGEGGSDIDFDTVLFDYLNALPLPGWTVMVMMVLAVVLIAIFFVTGADSASIVMGTLSEHGTTEPTRRTVVFWGVAVGAAAAAMLLAGGRDPSNALSALQNITIVSALPFVLVMMLLCVAIWRDLSRDPLVLKTRIARQVLEESVAEAVEKHPTSSFGLVTQPVEEPAAEHVSLADALREDTVHAARAAAGDDSPLPARGRRDGTHGRDGMHAGGVRPPAERPDDGGPTDGAPPAG
ncbi:BCCT family transporter [Citricoccus sp. SGAir0253]|uniref:BCCT family transporter n=1 Tax=Citricoccus sp. SGAir0253 TaxID=2567881 RepID=UPI0010CCFD20|nr:BCCT family transporter [Citricoccus sp. SGAir0253]QCU78312.1 BCCT family transporter [Citricoccus sp. SGAir0253]